MKQLFVLIASSILSLTATAQQTELVGMWQQLDGDGKPTTQVKAFMPDGKLLGLSYNSDFTNSSVWFMSDYKPLNELAYIDHAFYHSNIDYQRDYFFTYAFESDSIMVTKYADYRLNNRMVIITERWKKMDKELPTYTDAEWQTLCQKSMAEFDRLPKEGQSVEQYAQELYKKADGYKKANKLDRATEPLLIRAELDTTNLQWQKDALELYAYNSLAPSVAEKIAQRYARLKEAKATEPSDTSLLNAYRMLAYLYNYRGNNGMVPMRRVASKIIDLETKAGHQPSKEYGMDYFMIGMSYMPEGKAQAMYDYMVKATDILEKVPDDVTKKTLGEIYMFQATCLSNLGREREAIELMMNKVLPNYVDEQGQPIEKVQTMLYPLMLTSYIELIKKNPKDKKLLKEYQQFLADKLVYAVFRTTEKKQNLFGEYLALERGSWTIEKPTASFNDDHILLLKDGTFVEYVKDKTSWPELSIAPVDAAKKQDVIKQWKAYKKSKKVKK